jgi:hypothetical protein
MILYRFDLIKKSFLIYTLEKTVEKIREIKQHH